MIDRGRLQTLLHRADTADLVGHIAGSDTRLTNALSVEFKNATFDDADACHEAARDELNARIPCRAERG